MRRFERLRQWAKVLKRDVLALWIAARDPRTPWIAKAVAGAVAAYAFSPIDLIPDFIPVVGYLDDLVIVPLGIALVVRLIPPALMIEYRQMATERSSRPRSLVAAVCVAFLWCLVALAVAYWVLRR